MSLKQLEKQLAELREELEQLRRGQRVPNATVAACYSSAFNHAAIGIMVLYPANKHDQPIISTHSLFIQDPTNPAEVIERTQKTLLNSLSTALVTLSTIQEEGHTIKIYIDWKDIAEDLSTATGIREELGEKSLSDGTSDEILDYLAELHASLRALSKSNRKPVIIAAYDLKDTYSQELVSKCRILTQEIQNKIQQRKEQSIASSIRPCPSSPEHPDQNDEDELRRLL